MAPLLLAKHLRIDYMVYIIIKKKAISSLDGLDAFFLLIQLSAVENIVHHTKRSNTIERCATA